MANELAHVNKLSTVEHEIARLMVDGLDHDDVILGEDVKAFWPLTLVQVARACGYPMKKSRNFFSAIIRPSTRSAAKSWTAGERPRRRVTW